MSIKIIDNYGMVYYINKMLNYLESNTDKESIEKNFTYFLTQLRDLTHDCFAKNGYVTLEDLTDFTKNMKEYFKKEGE